MVRKVGDTISYIFVNIPQEAAEKLEILLKSVSEWVCDFVNSWAASTAKNKQK